MFFTLTCNLLRFCRNIINKSTVYATKIFQLLNKIQKQNFISHFSCKQKKMIVLIYKLETEIKKIEKKIANWILFYGNLASSSQHLYTTYTIHIPIVCPYSLNQQN